MAVKYFTVESVATFVHHRGPTTLPGSPAERGPGATVLCVHDVAGNGNVFAGVLDSLAERRRPIAFDLPAHGRSGRLDSLGTIAEMAGYTKALADRLELTSPVLLGDGMGAAIALEAAATWPGWPATVIVCGGASATPAPTRAEIDELRLVTAGRSRRQFDTTGYAPETSRDDLPAGVRRVDEDRSSGDHRRPRGARRRGTDRHGSAPITAPVVVVVGEHEPPEARAAAEALAAAVANGRVVTLAGAGRRGRARAARGPRGDRRVGRRRRCGMTFSGAVAVAGVYEHPTRWAPEKTEFQIMAESAKGALDDAGLTIGDVDALFAASMTMGAMGIVDLAEYLDLKPTYLDGTNIGGSSFVAHVAHAAAAIHAGMCEVALVLYGSTAASSATAIGTGMGGERRDPAASFTSPYGMTTVGSYALVAQLHRQRFGTTAEQLAEIAVTMRHHASLNPVAKMRQPITVDDVLASRMISEPLHLLDCCIISDGGGAVVVTSAARARDLPKAPVLLLGCGESVAHQEIGAPDLLTTAARQSGRRAFSMAGVDARRHRPLHDLRLVHDHGAGDAREPRLLRHRRRRRLRDRRPDPSRRGASREPRRRRSLVEPPRHAGDLPRDRGGPATARRVWTPPGRRRASSRVCTAPAVRSGWRTVVRR